MDGLTELVREFRNNIIRELERQEKSLKSLEHRLRDLETQHAVISVKVMAIGSGIALVISWVMNWLLKH